MTSICAAPACSKRALIHEAERYQLPRLRYSHHETPDPGHRLSPRCTACSSACRLAQRPYVLLASIGAGAFVATGPHLATGCAALLATGRAALLATGCAALLATGCAALLATGCAALLATGRAALLATGRAALYATDAALPSALELRAAYIRLRRLGLRRSPQRRSVVLEPRA